jgi:hypothetical protein
MSTYRREHVNMHVHICNMHVKKKSHVNMEHLFLMAREDAARDQGVE